MNTEIILLACIIQLILTIRYSKLQLKPPQMTFVPSMHFGDADGFYDLLDELIGSIYKQGLLIPRLAKNLGVENYQVSFLK
jgi:hypothetical protein